MNWKNKEEVKKYKHEWYIKNKEEISKRVKKYEHLHPEIYRKSHAKWQKNNKDKVYQKIKTYRKNNKVKTNARTMAHQKISLNNKICEICGNKAECRHHEDYNDPIKVNILCNNCHYILHKGRLKS